MSSIHSHPQSKVNLEVGTSDTPSAPPKDERGHGLRIDPSSRGKDSGDSSCRDAEGTGCSQGQHVELLQERGPTGKAEKFVVHSLGHLPGNWQWGKN